jgi:hypothetical protein
MSRAPRLPRGADRALVFAGRERRLAFRADIIGRPQHRLAADEAVAVQVEFADDAQCGEVSGQRVAPDGQAALGIDQFQGADPGMVVVVKREAGAQWPFLPSTVVRGAREQAAIGDNDQAAGKLQAGVEVDFQPGLGFSPAASKGSTSAAQRSGQRRFVAGGILCNLWVIGRVYRKGCAACPRSIFSAG